MLQISRKQARQYLINYQGLDDSINRMGKEGILDFLSSVGSIQYDPLNIVGRNSDLVLQSRVKNYKPFLLKDLLYKDRLLIDGWDKMMSIYQMHEWPYFYHLRKIKEVSIKFTLNYRNSINALDYTQNVIDLLRKEGPKLSTQFDFGKTQNNKWGHGKLARATLDYLFHSGSVGVFDKNGTQKVYDLIKNIIPKEILETPNPFPKIKDFHKWLLKRRIGAIGLYWNASGVVWQGIDKEFNTKKYRERIIAELLDENILQLINVEGFKGSFYIKSEYPIKEVKETTPKVKFIAPLDNILWDRELINKLFDFKYKWEVYTPATQRKYGYYVLPVLFGTQFIARFEPRIDRKTNELILTNWWWEDNVKQKHLLKEDIKEGLVEFSDYLNTNKYRDETNAGLF